MYDKYGIACKTTGFWYYVIIVSKPGPHFGENRIEDLDCLNLNFEFCHKIAGKYGFQRESLISERSRTWRYKEQMDGRENGCKKARKIK